MSDEVMPAKELLLGSSAPMDPVHQGETEDRLMRFAQFRHLGMQRAEICRVMGISPGTHDRWEEHHLVLKWMADLQLKQETRVLMLKDRLNMEVNDLLDGLIRMAKDEQTPRAVRAAISQDLLDRQGDLPRKVETKAPATQVFTDEQFDRLMGGIMESAERRGSLVNVTPAKETLS